MQVSFGAKLMFEPENLIRKGDSKALREKIKPAVDMAKKYVDFPVMQRILEGDTIIFSREKGKNFKISVQVKKPSGEMLKKRQWTNSNGYIPEYEFENAIASLVCLSKKIQPFAGDNWIKALHRFLVMHPNTLVSSTPEANAILNRAYQTYRPKNIKT